MRRTRILWAVAAFILSAAIVAIPSGVAAQTDASLATIDITRYGGADRYATSLLIAEAVATDAGGDIESVVMVSGGHWADAVVAASAAGAAGAPVLMTPLDQLRGDALEFLQHIGVTQVTIVTTGAAPDTTVSEFVFSELEDAGIDAIRVGGLDRYLTGIAVARTLESPGSLYGEGTSAIIASGEVFADALVAGPLSAKAQVPVLLTPQSELHDAVAEYLSEAGIQHVLLMGGTAALSATVEADLEQLGISVDRMAGASRFETATMTAAFAAQSFPGDCFGGGHVGLARARVPFDSFSAAPLLARLCAPLLLTDPDEIPSSTSAFLDDVRADADAPVSMTVFGGDAAVSQAALDAYVGLDCGGGSSDPPTALFGDRDFAAEPVWSPDCRRIAFTQRGQLWLAEPDGSGATRVSTPGGIHPQHPSWSPDGTRFAFSNLEFVTTTAGREQRRHIFVMEADGSNLKQLTSGSYEDERPSWSPDGKQIAFHRLEFENLATRSGRAERYIVTMTSDGKRLKRIFGELAERAWANRVEWPWESQPAWSPDGKQIALKYRHRLAIANVDATSFKDDFRVFFDIGVRFGGSNISWSPDGTKIAISRHLVARSGRLSDDKSIAIVDVASGVATDITPRGEDHFNPHWSPDGRRILYQSHRGETSDGVYRTVGDRVFVVGVDHRP
ncbi:MAG: cell wall-binding repeat-containing protein [Acidimicrobiaceae bacterium]|nr:cell wall-binding repeat-containing protein [Acidimicrobiaceae bacterium]